MLIEKSIDHINNLVRRYSSLKASRDSIVDATESIISCYSKHGKVLVCGNGGSAADADHIVG